MKKTTATKKTKRYQDMTSAELAAATAEFDRESVADTFGAMTPAQRSRWQKLKRGRGRPKVGKGAKTIALTVEGGLLQRADKVAKRRRISRAKLFGEALESLLARQA